MCILLSDCETTQVDTILKIFLNDLIKLISCNFCKSEFIEKEPLTKGKDLRQIQYLSSKV